MTKTQRKKLVIDAWPKLIEALASEHLSMLGDTPEAIALFLIIEAVDERVRQKYLGKQAINALRATGWRGPV
jgi:hypothetical protein